MDDDDEPIFDSTPGTRIPGIRIPPILVDTYLENVCPSAVQYHRDLLPHLCLEAWMLGMLIMPKPTKKCRLVQMSRWWMNIPGLG